ncbi:regulator of hemoglobinization and erythroid cell expansion protein [Hirundo rustica]|uniref:regulator of hemoglobinization and erythroid cell expansion protein n=1 Tax=Hirundo rustica TaxID=43150 RepID=UPI001A95175C|nr:regulator of hemoglobinization and erythroid cell expansion protein [Hirundo rustica]
MGPFVFGCHQVLVPLCMPQTLETPGQEDDELLWIPAAASLGALVPYALLLLALYVMLSRKIAQHSCGMQASSSPGARPSPHPSPAPAASPGGDKAPKPGTPKSGAPKSGAPKSGAQTPSPAYTGSSDTSSETSEDSEDSPSCPQGRGSEENINYTSLVFPGKGHGPGSAQDYEDGKTGMDYVNVDPKKRKIHFWPFSSPRASKGVEYTEVKL